MAEMVKIYFMDIPYNYGQLHAGLANEKLAEDGIAAHVTTFINIDDLAYHLGGDMSRSVVVVPHYYDFEAVVNELIKYKNPPHVAYLQADGDARIVVPASAEQLGKNWSVIRYNISEFERFLKMCESLHARFENVPEDVFAVGVLLVNTCALNFVLSQCIDSDPRMKRVNMGSKNEILEKHSQCDVIIIPVENSDVYGKYYQAALCAIDVPVYVLYRCDLAEAQMVMPDAGVTNERFLKMESSEDMPVALQAIKKHFNSNNEQSVQQIYDASSVKSAVITRYFNLYNYTPEYAISDRKYDLAFLSAKITGPLVAVDQFAKHLRERLIAHSANAKSDGVDVNPYAFFALFIQLLQDRGIDCSGHLQMLADVVATPGCVDRDMCAAISEFCEIDLA